MAPYKTTSPLQVCLWMFLMASSQGWNNQMLLHRDSFQGNRQFSSSLLFEFPAVSEVECASRCSVTHGCLSITVTYFSHGIKCRCHSQVMTPGRTWVSIPRTIYLQLDKSEWLKKACQQDAECAVPMSQCIDSLCLCAPGYYFSHSQDGCVADCATEDLSTSLLTYPGFKIGSHNLYSFKGSYTRCVAVCVRDPEARTCDYGVQHDLEGLKCTVQADTKLTVPPNEWKENEGIHMQKTCA